MKLKNLLLGSVTAAGLMTGAAYAADLGVLTSVDVCDQLGISGLTISSDTNCLKISGEVSYTFTYGSWDEADFMDVDGPHDVDWGYGDGDAYVIGSDVAAKLNFEATADSSFGPAKAVLKLVASDIDSDESGNPVTVDEAYVSIGEGTVIMAGHKGSIYANGNDEPLNWLGLFNSQGVDAGVASGDEFTGTSNAIQLTADLGNGFSASAGLEELEGHGQFVGVVAYASDTVNGHVSIAANDVLVDDGDRGDWTMHAGLSATLDTIKLVAAVASSSDDNWNVLGSASAAFDMFTIAASVEADDDEYTGAGASLTADVADGVKLNVGGRWSTYYDDTSYEIAVGAEAAVAENVTLSGAVGYVYSEDDLSEDDAGKFGYGWAKLAWAPGGGFTASVKGTITSPMPDDTDYYDNGPGYKIETEFKKTFE